MHEMYTFLYTTEIKTKKYRSCKLNYKVAIRNTCEFKVYL